MLIWHRLEQTYHRSNTEPQPRYLTMKNLGSVKYIIKRHKRHQNEQADEIDDRDKCQKQKLTDELGQQMECESLLL